MYGIQFDGGALLCSQMNQGSSCHTVTDEYGCTDTDIWTLRRLLHCWMWSIWWGIFWWCGVALHHNIAPFVSMWMAISLGRYRDEIIEPIVIPFLRQHGPGITFQHDNARPHTARVVHYVLNQNNVNVLPWPANSPDLSPIEHVWDEMERRLRQLPQQPTDLRRRTRALIQVWNDIPQDFHTHVIGSMRRRCTAVINARGGHAQYWLGDFNICKYI